MFFLSVCSSFVDIFDVDHFIDSLKDDIRVVRELPDEYSWSTREYYGTAVRETRVKTAPVHGTVAVVYGEAINWRLGRIRLVLCCFSIEI